MPLTKWYLRKAVPYGVGIVFTAFLTAFFTAPTFAIPTGILGLAVLGVGAVIAAVIDSVIGITKTLSAIEKHAKLSIEKKELDFRETNQEKVFLLVLENKEWWLDADGVEVRFSNIYRLKATKPML